jgi:D-aminoacyl-tRNA deacylase
MRFALICSAADTAGMNIRDSLLEKFQYSEIGMFDSHQILDLKNAPAKIYTTDKELVYYENLSELLDGDFIIFMSRHKSAAGIPSLSVHSTGNWGEAGLGGFARRLSVAPAAFLKRAVQLLEELSVGSGYDVVQECTHHGPLISKPSMFIEIGSDEAHWKDKKAGSIIADVIFRIITENIPECKSAAGIGGLHTLSNFKKIILNSEYGISHACPKYMLASLTLETLIAAVENSAPKASAVIIDSKGLGAEKERVMELLSVFEKAHPEIKLLKTKDF